MLTQRAADLAVLIKAQRKALSYTQKGLAKFGGGWGNTLGQVVTDDTIGFAVSASLFRSDKT